MTTTTTPASAGESIYGADPAATAPAPAPAASTPPASEPAATPAPAPAAAAEPPAAPATDPAAEPKAGDPPAAGDQPPADPAARTVADYTFDLPDGFTADDTMLGRFRELALKNNLDPALAKDLQGLYVEATQAAGQRLQQEWTNITTGWRDEVMAMPAFAQDRWDQTCTRLGRVMEEFSTPEDRAAFDSTGLGNHPAFVRLVLNLTDALLEGDPTPPGNPTPNPGQRKGGRQSLGQSIYGDS